MIVQALLNGLFLGAIYALIALGYTMVYGILKLINFAHGEVYMMGAFFAYFCARFMGLSDQTPWLSLLILLVVSMGCAGMLGFLIERFAYRPMRHMPRINTLIVAIGMSLLLQYSAQTLFGADPKVFPKVFPVEVYALGESVTVTNVQIMTLLVAVALMLILEFIVRHTKTGKAMRAVSDNLAVAELMGINSNRIISITFILGSMLAAAAGVLVGFVYPKIDPLMGTLFGLKAFVAAVLGGIGNLTGAMLGGMIMGLVEALFSTYGASTYRDAVAFAILILILLFRPAGLLGKFQTEKV